MATEIRTITDTWCDVHLFDESERIEAEWSGDVSIDGVARHLDLCEKCRKKVIGQLPELLEKYGSKPDPKAPRVVADPRGRAEHECPACHGAFLSRASLTSHCRAIHKKPLAILEIEAGLEPTRKPPIQKKCPVPGCGKVVLSAQGYGSHMRTHPAAEQIPLAQAG